MNKILIFCSLFFVSLFTWHENGGTDYWWTQWSTLMFFCVAFISWHIYKRFHWSIALAFFWYMSNGIFHYLWRDNPLNAFTTLFRLNATYYGYEAMVCLLLMTGVFLLIQDELVLYLEECFAALCIIDSIYVIVQYLIGNDFLHRGGMLGNGSMNGCFIAITFCYLNFKSRGFSNTFLSQFINTGFWILPITAIFLSMTSIPIGILLVVLISKILINKTINLKYKLITSAIIISCILIVGYFLDPSNLFDSNGRLQAYNLFMSHWWNDTDWIINLIGSGSSISSAYLPQIQIFQKFRASGHDWFIWLHSDWLQLIIENGIIGIVIYLIAAFYLLLHSRLTRFSYVVCILLGYYACMLFNYPMHLALTSFLGLLIVRSIYVKRTCK